MSAYAHRANRIYPCCPPAAGRVWRRCMPPPGTSRCAVPIASSPARLPARPTPNSGPAAPWRRRTRSCVAATGQWRLPQAGAPPPGRSHCHCQADQGHAGPGHAHQHPCTTHCGHLPSHSETDTGTYRPPVRPAMTAQSGEAQPILPKQVRPSLHLVRERDRSGGECPGEEPPGTIFHFAALACTDRSCCFCPDMPMPKASSSPSAARPAASHKVVGKPSISTVCPPVHEPSEIPTLNTPT